MGIRSSRCQRPSILKSPARSCNRTIGSDLAFDPAEPTEPTRHARGRFQRDASACGCGELERAHCGHPSLTRGHLTFRGRGDATCLRKHLNQDDRGDNRGSWKVTVEIKIVRVRNPSSDRPLSRHDIFDDLKKPHRRLVRKVVYPSHRRPYHNTRLM